MVRYADDFVILCRSEDDAQAALEAVRQWTAQAGLTLHEQKTHVVDIAVGGFEFLGYRFERGRHGPRAKSLQKFKDAVRSKTRRANGHSLEQIIASLTPTLRGWYGYFKHSPRRTFSRLDGWIRMRLRSILRKRKGGRGCGRGIDHHHWPNAYFTERGLFSMLRAHVTECQSVRLR
jgi:RNA-directed DNA polymerase